MLRRPFTDEDLETFRLSIKASPNRWTRCKHSHLIDQGWIEPTMISWKLAGGWYVRYDCPETSCGACPSPGGGGGPCHSGVNLNLPDDPARHLFPPFPQHSSTQWRDKATLLPRTDGVYTRTVETRKPMFKPRVFDDACLVFTDEGEVLDDVIGHEGYDTEDFKARAAALFPKVRAGYRSCGPTSTWRGLYEVTGDALNCSLTEMAGERYGFTGTLSGDAGTLKLKKVDARGRKLAKQEYTFRPLAGAPAWTPPA
jgi:hypothetical protein